MTLKPGTTNRRGGPRPGSGRKPGALTLAFREHFEPSLPALLAALGDLALGHSREDDKKRVYVVAPDRASITYILDRLLGRPPTEGEPTADVAKLVEALRSGSNGTASPA